MSKVPSIALSVVVPVYHSAGTLGDLYGRIAAMAEQAGLTFECIFVDDGSTDGSWARLLELKRDYPERVSIIRLARNFGQHAATLCGIRHSQGEWVVTIDDDLQTPPEEIPKLLEKAAESKADVVYGVYPKKKHSFWRNVGSKLFKWVFRYLVAGLKDGSSFRLISRTIAEQIGTYDQHFVFLDQVISWYTTDVAFAPVNHEKRKEGKSGYSVFHLFRLAFRTIFHYTDLPLKFMIYAGLISSVLSMLAGIYFFFQWLFVGSLVGFTALILAIFFTGSVILLSLGVLGEYIGRIYHSRLDRPVYSIKVKL